jgi:hypothetical protein
VLSTSQRGEFTGVRARVKRKGKILVKEKQMSDAELIERKRCRFGGNWMMVPKLKEMKIGDVVYKHCISICQSEYLRKYRFIGMDKEWTLAGLFEVIPIGSDKVIKVTRMDEDDIGISFKRYPSEKYVALEQLKVRDELKYLIYEYIRI